MCRSKRRSGRKRRPVSLTRSSWRTTEPNESLMTLTIPPDDASDFAALPDEIRAEVRQWLRAIAPLFKCSHGEQGNAIASIARQFNVSAKTVRRKWDAFRATV